MIMQCFRTRIGCAINTTSHAEGYHSSLKVKPCPIRMLIAACMDLCTTAFTLDDIPAMPTSSLHATAAQTWKD